MQSKEGTLQYIVYGFWDYFDERIFIADEPQTNPQKTHPRMRFLLRCKGLWLLTFSFRRWTTCDSQRLNV